MTHQAIGSWRRCVLVAAVFSLASLVLLSLQLRSSIHMLYHGEAVANSNVLLALWEGSYEWRGLTWLIRELSYMEHAQGTVLVQSLAIVLSLLLGPNVWSMYASGILLHVAGVFCLVLLLTRLARSATDLVFALPLLFPPLLVQTYNLTPFGNHSEFLWIPALMALILHERAPDLGRRTIAALILLGVAGLVLYRLNVAAVGAATLVVASLGRRHWVKAVALAVFALAGAVAVLAAGFVDSAMQTVPYSQDVVRHSSSGVSAMGMAGQLIRTLVHDFPALQWSPWSRPLHLGLLFMGLAGCAVLSLGPLTGRTIVARFAVSWFALVVLAMAASDLTFPRYCIPAYYAAVVAFALLGMQLRPPVLKWVAAALALLLALGGLAQGSHLVERSVWPLNRRPPDLEFYYRMVVWSVDLDELPYYHRILDEGRGSEWIGAMSLYDGALCTDALKENSVPTAPDPAADYCTGFTSQEVCPLLAKLAADLADDRAPRAIADVGRSVWIRSNRDMDRVHEALRECDEPWRTFVLDGAVDEAERWGMPGWTVQSPAGAPETSTP